MSGATAIATPADKFKVTFNKNYSYIIIISLLVLSTTLYGLNMGLYGYTTNDFVKECKKPSMDCNNVNKEGNTSICRTQCNADEQLIGNPEYQEQPTNCLIRKANAHRDFVANIGYWYIGLTGFFLLYIAFFVFIYIYIIRKV
jgi:hypothetical protein